MINTIVVHEEGTTKMREISFEDVKTVVELGERENNKCRTLKSWTCRIKRDGQHLLVSYHNGQTSKLVRLPLFKQEIN